MKTIQNYLTRIFDREGMNQLMIRLAIGTVMWPHGAQLLLGWFGGGGFTNTMQFLTEITGLPWLIAFAVILIQFFGSVFIVIGLFTRFSAFCMSVITIGMIFSGHIEHGFFMNWFGNQKGEGFEFHILLLGLSSALLFFREYKYSVDSLFTKNK